MIRILAKSLGGSEHIIKGRVRDKQGVPYESEADARGHLKAIGWKEVRFEVERRESGELIYTLWDDQRWTTHQKDSDTFEYKKKK